MLLDLTPLKRRDFRLLFVGQLVSLAGTMMSLVAVPYQIWELTHSALLVGLLSAVQLVPVMATALVGGAFADAVDRRRLLLVSELLLAVTSVGLAWNAMLPAPSITVVFVLSAFASALTGFHRPALDALTPRLVAPEEIPAANALVALRSTVALVGGSAAGGLAIAALGVPATYVLDAGSFALSLVALAGIRSMGAPGKGERPSLKSIGEGLRYARSRQELLGIYLVDIGAITFGMPSALLPALADRWGGAKALGWLNAAPFVGAALVSLFSGWTHRVRRHGAAVALSAGLWGVTIVAFGLSSAFVPALLFLTLSGALDMVSGLFRMRISNETVPDEVRGRIGGLEIVAYLTGPYLGNFEAGLVAEAWSVTASVVSGGVFCVAAVLAIVLRLPGLWSYLAPGTGEVREAKAG